MLNNRPTSSASGPSCRRRGRARTLEKSGKPLTSVETGTELRRFDMLAFSVSFENDYLHVLQMLRMAGIPLRPEQRTAATPSSSSAAPLCS